MNKIKLIYFIVFGFVQPIVGCNLAAMARSKHNASLPTDIAMGEARWARPYPPPPPPIEMQPMIKM